MGGGLAVGALAILADGLGASSQDVLFSGQASIPSLVMEDSARIVLVLLAVPAAALAAVAAWLTTAAIDERFPVWRVT